MAAAEARYSENRRRAARRGIISTPGKRGARQKHKPWRHCTLTGVRLVTCGLTAQLDGDKGRKARADLLSPLTWYESLARKDGSARQGGIERKRRLQSFIYKPVGSAHRLGRIGLPLVDSGL